LNCFLSLSSSSLLLFAFAMSAQHKSESCTATEIGLYGYTDTN
jgi:hypothetical protein